MKKNEEKWKKANLGVKTPKFWCSLRVFFCVASDLEIKSDYLQAMVVRVPLQFGGSEANVMHMVYKYLLRVIACALQEKETTLLKKVTALKRARQVTVNSRETLTTFADIYEMTNNI